MHIISKVLIAELRYAATGSILRPGLWGGLFGLRPTWNAVSYKGMGAAVE